MENNELPENEKLFERNHRVERNIPLVVSMAKQYKDQGVDFEDLVQEGILGLIHASDRFDPDRGLQFSTYAVWWIRQSLREAVKRHGGAIRKPTNYYRSLKKIFGMDFADSNMGRKEFFAEKIRECLEKDRNLAVSILPLLAETLSLEFFPDDDGENWQHADSLADGGSDDLSSSLMTQQFKEDIVESLKTLAPRERDIIKMRYGLDGGERYSLKSIGERFNISPERVRQIENTALRKIRASTANIKLRAYLD
ncbi:MAG: RNA polymerase sigma factor RpoD/SigA [bacterium]